MMKSVVAGVGLSAALVALPAAAQLNLSGLYAGVGVGQSKAKDWCTGAVFISCDDKDTAWKIFGGYQFNPHFAVEGGYADLGKVKGSGVTSGVNLDASTKLSAWDVAAVGSWPFASQFSVFGKLGAYYGTVDSTGTASGAGGSASAAAKDSNVGFTYGLGARYDFTRNLAARAEWQRYNKMGGDNTGKSDVDVLGLSLLWKFI